MNPADVNMIVDNLSDKIGVAASELQAVTQTVVEEVATYGYYRMLAGVIMLVVFGVWGPLTSFLAYRLIENDEVRKFTCNDGPNAAAAIFVVLGSILLSLVGIIAGLINAWAGLAEYSRPTTEVIKLLLK